MAEDTANDVVADAASEDGELHELPAPAPLAPTRGPVQWRVVRAALAAAVVAFAAGAFVGDSRTDEGDDAAIAAGTAVPVPVLAPAAGDDLSAAVSSYGIAPWSSPTRAVVLGAWGATAVDPASGTVAQVVPPVDGEPLLADDPRLADPAAPAFVDPCAARGTAPEGCPPVGRTRPASVLGTADRPSNAVVVRPYPQPDTELAESCTFADVAADEIPVAVVTANPGFVQLTVGGERAIARSSRSEGAAWSDWRARALGPRPPSTFVAHCLVVDRPEGPGPFPVQAIATDDSDSSVVALGAVVPLGDGTPASVAVLDDSLLQVEVPTTPDAPAAAVTAVPLAALGGIADCAAASQVAASLAPAWRAGAASRVTTPADGASRPYLASAPAVDRAVVPVAEGEPSLLCITGGADQAAAALVVHPPDARRLRLAVTDLRLDGAPPADVEVTGTFAELGWTPCAARLAGTAPAPVEEVPPGPDAEAPADPGAGLPVDPEAPSGGAQPADPEAASGGAQPADPEAPAEGPPVELAVLCTSGGDTGAVLAAGGLLDLAVTAGGATYAARIALDPTPGAEPSTSYRLPIPSGAVDAGGLCTAGVASPGCRPPTGENVVGSLVVTASWDEGPIGAGDWTFTAAS